MHKHNVSNNLVVKINKLLQLSICASSPFFIKKRRRQLLKSRAGLRLFQTQMNWPLWCKERYEVPLLSIRDRHCTTEPSSTSLSPTFYNSSQTKKLTWNKSGA